jgi:uncharacterized protein (TIGR03083 family)
MTALTLAPTAPRRSALDRDVAMRLAAEEYQRVIRVLRALPEEAWARPTDCTAWDVRQLVAHLLGMAEMAASLPEQLRQMRAAKRAGGLFIDALTAHQVAKHQRRTPQQLTERYAAVAPKAAKARRRTPGFVRSRAMGDPQPVGANTPPEAWTFGYLIDVILTRDPWMHRTELVAAGGLEMELTPQHDGVLVADIAEEWAGRHGQPCTLVLTGPAGGQLSWGTGGPTLELDAVEFCRILSGRGQGEGLLATEVPF